MVFVVAPLLRHSIGTGSRSPAGPRVGVVVAVIAASSVATGHLGLHVIFGALAVGVAMPRDRDGEPDPAIAGPISQAGQILLPLFFVVSGMSVDIGDLRGGDFVLLAAVLLLAFGSKVAGGSLAGRLAGLSWVDAGLVGTLLSTRGLTELIVLNVGLQANLIDRRLYSVLVLSRITWPAFKCRRTPSR
jgi:Kef-type K+ transport system membrane component KefB